MSKCRVCQSTLRKEIEGQIINGVSYVNIAEFTQAHGDFISHMTIMRHNSAGHIVGFKRVGNPDSQKENGLSEDEVESMVDSDLTVDIPSVNNADELKNFTRESIMQITANQLAIIRHKQEKFMRGEGRYPQNEILGLRTVVACLDSITEGRGRVLNVDNIGKKDN